jgi:hypothetical protein
MIGLMVENFDVVLVIKRWIMIILTVDESKVCCMELDRRDASGMVGISAMELLQRWNFVIELGFLLSSEIR